MMRWLKRLVVTALILGALAGAGWVALQGYLESRVAERVDRMAANLPEGTELTYGRVTVDVVERAATFTDVRG